jgi:protein-disulfide isomerase
LTPPRRRWVPIAGLSLAAAALLTGIVFIAVGEEGPLAPVEGADTVQRLFGGIDQDGDSLGDSGAPVTVTIFNDLQCTDCADYHLETVPPLVEALVRRGDARLEFRNRAIGQKVVTEAALAATAAGLQDYEWHYVYLVFLNQEQVEVTGTSDEFSGEFLERVAEAIPAPEFDVAQWEEDRVTPEVEAQVESDDQTAVDLGIASPTVVVEGPAGTVTLEDSPTVAQIEAAVAEVR